MGKDISEEEFLERKQCLFVFWEGRTNTEVVKSWITWKMK